MKRLLPLLLAATFSAAVASPTSPVVVAGQATFNQQGNVFTITNTPNTIINWQSFSVAPGEVTRFVQQSASSAVLNRILGQDPTQILGALQSNGQVFLINPNGVMFGKDARIDVAGLTASTLNLTDADFLAGRRNFAAGPAAGNISNQGAISAQPGGHVFLIAPNVENTGIISAPNGDVVLAAGRQVQLVDSRDPDMHVVVSAPEDKAINLGQVISQGGRIGIYGALVKQRGEVNANSAVVGQNGKIVLKASGDTLLEEGSKTTATGAGNGGSVHVLGNRVAMTGNAQIDVSGGANGGTVLMGGDYRGENPLYASAQQTWMGTNASIKADAGSAGKGGKVILWAKEATSASGSISARGGAASGDGGLIETSADNLVVNGLRVDTGAVKGKKGLWLLDPLNITVGSPSCGIDVCFALDDTKLFSIRPTESGQISVATLLAANSDIWLEAKNNIRFNDALNAGAHNITALAGGSIDVDAPLTTSAGTITLHANNGTFGATGNGAVNINQQIRTNGGSVMLRGASINVAAMADPNVAAIDSAGGRIDMVADALAEGTVNIKGLVKSGGGYVALSGPGLVIGDSALPGKGGIDSSGGFIDLTADSLSISAPVKAGLPGTTSLVTILPLDRSLPIWIGGSPSVDALKLTNSELGNIHAGQLRIGGFDLTGDINWSLAGGYTDFGTISLATQNTVTINNLLENQFATGRIDINANTIDLATGATGNGEVRANTISLTADNVIVGGSLKSDTGAAGASINIATNNLAVGGSVNSGAGNIFIRPKDDATPVEIAAVKEEGKLALTPTELARFSGDTLILGSSAVTGGLTVKAGTTTVLHNLRSLSLNSGGPLNFDGSIELTHLDGALLASSFGGAVNVGTGGALMAPFVFVNAASLDLNGMIDADSVLIQGDSSVSSIHVGTGATDSAGILGLSKDELGRISTSGLTISAFPGASGKRIDVVGALDWGYVDTTLKLAAGLGDISIKAPLSTVGEIALQSGGQIDQTATGGITASLLSIDAPVGSSVDVFLDASGANNNVRELTASGIQHLAFDTNGTLVIGGANGIAVAPQSVGSWIDINAAGELQMAKPIYAPDGTVRLGGLSVIIGSDAPVLSFGATSGPANIFADFVSLEARSGKIELLDNGYIDSFYVNLVADKMEFSPLAGIHTPSEGDVSISTYDYNKSIRLGQGALDIDGIALGLTDDELRIIDASFISIGGYSEGAVTEKVEVVGALDLSSTTRLISLGLYAENGVVIDAPLTVPNGVDIATNGNVQLNDSIRATARGITIDGDAILGAGLLKAAQYIDIYATSGIGSPTAPINTETPWLYLSNQDTYSEVGTPINVRNNAAAPAPLYIEYAGQESGGKGSISIENFGGMHVGDVSASTGEVNLTTHSPMTIDGSVTTTTGAIKLVAEGTDGNITLASGALVASETGDITLNAGGAITAPDGSITTGGTKTLTAGVVTTPPPAPTLAECLATPAITGCATVLNAALDACIADKTGSYCAQVLPTMTMCIADETRKGCSVVLPTLEQCLANRTAEGCSVVLPTTAECAATPSLPGCVASGPTLEQCIANPSISGCSSVLPPLAVCIANKSTPGCQVVMPDLSVCIADKTTAGCEAVLPDLAQCIADKSAPGCGVVLPSLEVCIANKATAGCEVVLPNLATCIANKATPGCQVVLPDLAACIADRTAPGCDTVLPNMAACIADKTTPGCEVILPNLTACIADKTAPGCEVVLPNLAACVANKATPGCEVVLPTLAACIANKAAPGCEVVLPSIAACVANKNALGCEVVLPNLAACIADKTAAGCEVVLPTIAVCVADKSTAGCEVVLPKLAACIADKATAGCEVVLPKLAACVADKTTAGCEVVLPTIAVCVADKTIAGCEVVLPTMAACIANKATAGCQVVLPPLEVCIANTSAPGCEVVLPTVAQCVVNPTLGGCDVVLPTLAQCIADKSKPGCQIILPTMAECIGSPTLGGCSVILPKLEQCAVNPNLQGCEAVLPKPDFCATHPTDPTCQIFSPGTGQQGGQEKAPVTQAVQTSVTLVSKNPQPQTGVPTGSTSTGTGSGSEQSQGQQQSEPEKQAEKEQGTAPADNSGVKNEKPATKLYCN